MSNRICIVSSYTYHSSRNYNYRHQHYLY